MDSHDYALAVLVLYACLMVACLMGWQGPDDDEKRPPPRP